MDQDELQFWREKTASSADRWMEDEIKRLNGDGCLFYRGGENGQFIRISKENELTIGTYEGAFPHIGEAEFTIRYSKQYTNINEAFEAACQYGGTDFLTDLFSSHDGMNMY